jgi:hypothetical protein
MNKLHSIVDKFGKRLRRKGQEAVAHSKQVQADREAPAKQVAAAIDSKRQWLASGPKQVRPSAEMTMAELDAIRGSTGNMGSIPPFVSSLGAVPPRRK